MVKHNNIVIQNLSQIKDNKKILDNINLNIPINKVICLVGPSACGKTSLLRVIAGLDKFNSGEIFFDNKLISKPQFSIPTEDRNIGLVFQESNLFPHLNIYKNVSFGSKRKKFKDIQKETFEILKKIGLPHFSNIYPHQLSGGQKQRVALARALINKPKVLLLDEPLGALDLKLREQMQVELKSLQRQFNITFIYVTHDQQEALSMSDRIAVLNEGKIEQIGTPSEIYSSPNSSFVANFVGTSNIFDKSIAKEVFDIDSAFSIRPEKISLLINEADNQYSIDGKIIEKQFHGSFVKLIIETTFSKQLIVNLNQSNPNLSLGNEIKLGWSKEDIITLDK